MSLLTIGTVAFDDIEIPFGKVEKAIGGACTYASYAASYFTDNIRLCSIVGADFPMNEIKALENRGVDMEGLQIKQDGLTFFWAGKYQELVVLDTMNFWMDIAMDSLLEVIAKVDVITINDEEARQLSGEYSLVNAAAKIHKMGPKYVIIKKGEHGALLFSEGEIFSAPALPLAQVFDPTGAGDTFAGGFIGYLAHTEDISFDNMKRAIMYGSCMASFCVEEFSIEKLRNLSNDDIVERMGQFKAMTHFEL